MFDDSWSAEEIFKRAWCMKEGGNEVDAQVRWVAWEEKQMALREKTLASKERGGEEVVALRAVDSAVDHEEHLKLEDLGFASTRRHTPFPALAVSSDCASGTKKVRFFGTGEVVLVPESHWIPYSEEEASVLLADKIVNKCGFAAALSQLSALTAGVMGNEHGEQVIQSMAGKGRHLVPLTARGLAEDEQYNNSVFTAKMSRVDNFWTRGNKKQ